jgi:hypothetical protein
VEIFSFFSVHQRSFSACISGKKIREVFGKINRKGRRGRKEE